MIRTYDQWINSPHHFHYPQLSTEFNSNRIKLLGIFSRLETAVERWRLLTASGENLGKRKHHQHRVVQQFDQSIKMA